MPDANYQVIGTTPGILEEVMRRRHLPDTIGAPNLQMTQAHPNYRQLLFSYAHGIRGFAEIWTKCSSATASDITLPLDMDGASTDARAAYVCVSICHS